MKKIIKIILNLFGWYRHFSSSPSGSPSPDEKTMSLNKKQ